MEQSVRGPICEQCKGVPSENPKENIPQCNDVLENGTCRVYTNPGYWWKNGKICPRSNQSTAKYVSEFSGRFRKTNPLKQSKRGK